MKLPRIIDASGTTITIAWERREFAAGDYIFTRPRMTRYDRYIALRTALERCDWYSDRWGWLMQAWNRVGGLIYPDA